MSQHTKKLAAFRALIEGARIQHPDYGPEGRIAVLLYLTPDGFVFVEPGYQDPWNSIPRAHYRKGELTVTSQGLAFPGGTIIEAEGADAGAPIFHWQAYLADQGRNYDQEREHVMKSHLGGEWQGKPLA